MFDHLRCYSVERVKVCLQSRKFVKLSTEQKIWPTEKTYVLCSLQFFGDCKKCANDDMHLLCK